ncbi:MAG: hypothetical protein QME50_07330, partial [Candidatus Bathyarchaeota archaeon]|nr:hypothetical protein [Candidatus Bathyarchaeota archaeon]
RDVVINAYTKQGFKAVSKTVKTPSPVVLKITALDFNLTNTNSFSVSVQNMPCSIQEANITRFTVFCNNSFTEINETTPVLPDILAVGEPPKTFNCIFNWTAFEGLKINVTVYTSEGFNATYTYTLPKVQLNVDFDSSKSTSYFSITIQNNAYTTIKVTEIYVNDRWRINANLTYPVLPALVDDGESILIVCPFDWQSLSGNEVTITVKTENGFDIKTTLVIP